MSVFLYFLSLYELIFHIAKSMGLLGFEILRFTMHKRLSSLFKIVIICLCRVFHLMGRHYQISIVRNMTLYFRSSLI